MIVALLVVKFQCVWGIVAIYESLHGVGFYCGFMWSKDVFPHIKLKKGWGGAIALNCLEKRKPRMIINIWLFPECWQGSIPCSRPITKELDVGAFQFRFLTTVPKMLR